ncbi:MAG: hypothetical protein JNN22_08125 [Rhodospirillales bacterium]|nr:hypothetical protein [Rhodospirillales bacterium]
MEIQAGTPSIASGLPRPDSARVSGRAPFQLRGGQSSFAPSSGGVPARASGIPEALQAIAANFAEDARPSRVLPRGSLVDLVI